jgi:hypothetical protein
MTNLEQIIIHGGEEVTDEGITGIKNIFELMTIYDSINGLSEDEDGEGEADDDPMMQLSRQIPHIRTHPSIMNLQSKLHY